MSPDPSIDPEDDTYVSEADSDFAPDEAQDAGSEQSESEDDSLEPTATKRSATSRGDAQGDGCDNSGDEAIISKGRKRQKRAKNKGEIFDDEAGGDGGLVKTRRQRAEEKEERRYAAAQGPVTIDVDAVWQQMMSGKTVQSATTTASQPDDSKAGVNGTAGDDQIAQPDGDSSDTIRIKRTYNFAGRVHAEEKVVARDSAEAKLYLASQSQDGPPLDVSPTKRATKKAFRSAFEPIVDAGLGRTDLNLGVTARLQAAKEAQAKKLNTVEKSRMDWAGFVDKEGIQDELELASKSKGSYGAREAFLARSEARREDEARRARMATRA
ncbi:swr complex subunit [Purpureocillium takamizusanense]|uniref:SWR1-complex protein 5 n=1 Tax=Purpureocillium takamizusanense TaxID=2060973 RepID=A0A9Q8Q888_9HYPO|nr:swr complex subunit [Purpureocillium takamizusanense]UNI14212.1 swr complex subunit [Purpureocillium takamizusanense]